MNCINLIAQSTYILNSGSHIRTHVTSYTLLVLSTTNINLSEIIDVQAFFSFIVKTIRTLRNLFAIILQTLDRKLYFI